MAHERKVRTEGGHELTPVSCKKPRVLHPVTGIERKDVCQMRRIKS